MPRSFLCSLLFLLRNCRIVELTGCPIRWCHQWRVRELLCSRPREHWMLSWFQSRFSDRCVLILHPGLLFAFLWWLRRWAPAAVLISYAEHLALVFSHLLTRLFAAVLLGLRALYILDTRHMSCTCFEMSSPCLWFVCLVILLTCLSWGKRFSFWRVYFIGV